MRLCSGAPAITWATQASIPLRQAVSACSILAVAWWVAGPGCAFWVPASTCASRATLLSCGALRRINAAARSSRGASAHTTFALKVCALSSTLTWIHMLLPPPHTRWLRADHRCNVAVGSLVVCLFLPFLSPSVTPAGTGFLSDNPETGTEPHDIEDLVDTGKKKNVCVLPGPRGGNLPGATDSLAPPCHAHVPASWLIFPRPAAACSDSKKRRPSLRQCVSFGGRAGAPTS